MDVGKLGSNIINSYDIDKNLKPIEPINKNGPMDVSTYMGLLSKKFSSHQVSAGVVTSSSIPSGNSTITIAPNVLKAMAEDPEVAAKYEGFLSDCMKLEPQFNRMCAARGMEVVSSGTFINPDGTTGGYSVTQTKGGSDNKKTELHSLDTILEKAKARRAAQAKRQTEIEKDRALSKQIESEFNFTNRSGTDTQWIKDSAGGNGIDCYV
ncbi:MAG TPA: DUF6033 family protein [Chitinispirillaceae bacterium]|nr:DUF6033 family protein [Chitinispirillaceae bacterium]